MKLISGQGKTKQKIIKLGKGIVKCIMLKSIYSLLSSNRNNKK